MFVDHHDSLRATTADQCARQRTTPTAQRDEVDEVGRRRAVGLAHLDPVLLGELWSVDVGHRFVGNGAEEALEDRQGEDPGVVAGDVAFGAHLDLSRRAADQ